MANNSVRTEKLSTLRRYRGLVAKTVFKYEDEVRGKACGPIMLRLTDGAAVRSEEWVWLSQAREISALLGGEFEEN